MCEGIQKTVRWRPTELAVFCEWESNRYPGTLSPFKKGDWVYATDGRVAVRIPWSGDVEPTGKTPDVDSVFTEFDAAGCTEPWPPWKNIPRDDTGESADWHREVPVQHVAGRRIEGICWLKVASLGKEVRFASTLTAALALLISTSWPLSGTLKSSWAMTSTSAMSPSLKATSLVFLVGGKRSIERTTKTVM